MKIITDIKLTGSLKMFRIHLTNKYHFCFMRNYSYINGKKGITISLMKRNALYHGENTYNSILKIIE